MKFLLFLLPIFFLFPFVAKADTITLYNPECIGGICDDLESRTDWRFEMSYTLTDSADYETSIVVFGRNCDFAYENCDYDSENISFLDPDSNGIFLSPSYWPVEVPTDASTLKYRYDIIPSGESSSANYVFDTVLCETGTCQEYTPPENTDCENFIGGSIGYYACILFLPNQETLELFTDSLPAELRAKEPFSFFYLVSDGLDTLSGGDECFTRNFDLFNVFKINQASAVIIPPPSDPCDVTIGIDYLEHESDFKVIDTQEPLVKEAHDIFSPIMTWILWLGAAFYVYERVKHIEV